MKSYTNLEQSKKLAEILPLESADYTHLGKDEDNVLTRPYLECCSSELKEWVGKDEMYPCWSLAALLGVLEHPRCFQGDKPTYWFCGCFGKDKLYHEVEASNPIDVCVSMIEYLHELKML